MGNFSTNEQWCAALLLCVSAGHLASINTKLYWTTPQFLSSVTTRVCGGDQVGKEECVCVCVRLCVRACVCEVTRELLCV